MSSLLWCNGCPVDHSAGVDRLQSFGDGVCETMLLRQPPETAASLSTRLTPSEARDIHLYEAHMQRLEHGLQRLGLNCRLEQVESDISVALKTNISSPLAVVKLVVSRGVSGFGYRPDESAASRYVMVSTLPELADVNASAVFTVCLSPIKLGRQPLLAGIKHCSRLEQVLAARDSATRGFDEAIMLDSSGCVIEAIAANIFALHGDTLVTPALGNAGVAGVMREFVIAKAAGEHNLRIEERELSITDIREADALALTNCIRGFRIVTRFEEVEYPASPVLSALASWVRSAQLGQGDQ